jgi:hypothetical protein
MMMMKIEHVFFYILKCKFWHVVFSAEINENRPEETKPILCFKRAPKTNTFLQNIRKTYERETRK